MPSATDRRPRRGLSLVETVVAAGVLSLIVIFVVGMIPSFKMSNRRANMELQAGSLAQSGLEQIRAVPFADVASTALPDTVIDGITYKRRVIVTDVVTHGTPPVEIAHTVRVEVTWRCWQMDYRVFRETTLCRLLRS